MSAARFTIVAENPNDQVGGGGCACGDGKQTGCAGPYALFHATETDSGASPHVVISLACLEAAVEASDGDVLRPTEDRLP